MTVTYDRIHQWHIADVLNLSNRGGDMPQCHSLEHKLLHGRIRLWQDVQNKTRTFLLSSDLWHFHIDEFLRVLDMVDRLVQVCMTNLLTVVIIWY